MILDVKGRYTHPPCFWKRGCKALKTKNRSAKRRGKRVQEAARMGEKGDRRSRGRNGLREEAWS
jgi:hypothetical protein